MPINFLIDANTNPLANSEINDVVYNTDDIPMGAGNFVLAIPDGLEFDVDAVADLQDVLDAKYAAWLAFYAGYASIVYEDFLDSTGINTASSTGIHTGGRQTTQLRPAGVLRTVTVPLGATPTSAFIVWEVFGVTFTSPADEGALVRTYETLPPTTFTVEVSFNNGGTFQPVVEGALHTIALADQGTNLILRFTNGSGSPQFLASWAVVY